jgi:hypothetical protein
MYVYILYVCVHTPCMCTYSMYVYILHVCVHTLCMCTYSMYVYILYVRVYTLMYVYTLCVYIYSMYVYVHAVVRVDIGCECVYVNPNAKGSLRCFPKYTYIYHNTNGYNYVCMCVFSHVCMTRRWSCTSIRMLKSTFMHAYRYDGLQGLRWTALTWHVYIHT